MRRLIFRLEDIIEAIDNIQNAVEKGYEAFHNDPYIQVWVLHHIQLIGEAVRSSIDDLTSLDSDVPWAQIVAMRNIIVHQYFGVDNDDVWNVATVNIPELKNHIQNILLKINEKPDK